MLDDKCKKEIKRKARSFLKGLDDTDKDEGYDTSYGFHLRHISNFLEHLGIIKNEDELDVKKNGY